jgi:ribosomal protein S18 acetylase RimI-like enzyme
MTDPETRPPHAVRIRPATLADAATLTELGARTFRDTFAADNTPEDVEAFLAAHYRPELQEAELKDPRNLYLLAEVSGVPAGFALLRRNARALAFYSRWGFTEVGEMRFLLGDDLQRDLVFALAL